MTEQDIIVLLTQHSEQIASLNKRSTELWGFYKKFTETMSELTFAVQELTNSVKNSHDTQERIIERLDKLESEPAEKWDTVTKTAITAIVSAIAGAFAIGLVQMIAGNM